MEVVIDGVRYVPAVDVAELVSVDPAAANKAVNPHEED